MFNARLIEHMESPYHRGRAPHATHAHEQSNPVCGDVVRIELVIEPSAGWWTESRSNRPHPGPGYPLAGAEGEGVGVVREAYFDGHRLTSRPHPGPLPAGEGDLGSARPPPQCSSSTSKDAASTKSNAFPPPTCWPSSAPVSPPFPSAVAFLAWQALQVAIYSPIKGSG